MKLIIALIVISIGSASTEENDLQYELLRYYDKTMTPVDANETTLSLYVTLSIKNIIELDIKQGILTSHLMLGIRWQDNNLKWNDSMSSRNHIDVTLSKIWYPNIQICNSVSGDFSFDVDKEVTVKYDGFVHLHIDKIFKTYCRINVENYPFDQHECDITVCLEHQMYMEETIEDFVIDVKLKTKSNQWNFSFEETEMEKDDVIAAGLIVYGKRKVSSATITKIIPPIMLTLLVLSVHVLPASSGEKVCAAITVFLTNIVFLSETEKILGNNSQDPSLYLIYLLILTFVSGCSSIESVIVCKLYAQQTGSDINLTPEIARESKGSRNSVGVIENSDEQNIKVRDINLSKRHFINYQKLDKIFLSIVVIFLVVLYIIFALSSSY
ncbi:acetylcholine receptor subunit beta-type unc-29 [Octopus bimaculoides]|uniref:Neurotransmitter-gated ion-channel ligand-binding domain-containing protein n=1 Tax=Octopus bimaculoides TaxID=37653 RepID=A0A0L8HL14_OCTBM|nr:acetylcholine receptor subunit beta-type unc-29 [Octopus bimaculoides]|eukprot:XP_014771427.1 PREDICTED: acetylcholine receptor subunit beta-type unc-29-like [Octopus bimaculoides]